MSRLTPLALLLLCALLASTAGAVLASQPEARLADGEYRAVLNGVEHWYRVAGARHATTPLVIVHGGPGGNHYVFERSAGLELEKFATVVYYEQRGSGRSAAPADPDAYSIPLLVADLDALRERLGVARVRLLGYSFGGELALEYALAHPDRVEALVLEGPSTSDWERMQSTHLFGFQAITTGELGRKVREAARSDAPLADRWNAVWNLVDTQTVDRLLFHDQEVARRNRKMWDESGLRNTGQMARALMKQRGSGEPLLERARSLRARALLVVGLHDRNVGVDTVRDLASAIPNARLQVFERSAHFPDLEETPRFVAAVRAFLAER